MSYCYPNTLLFRDGSQQSPGICRVLSILLLLLCLLLPTCLTAAQPPAPLVQTSSIQFFRELLAMSSMDQELALAEKPEAKRQVLLAKITEYNALPALEREQRLQRLELPGYLLPLLNASAELRALRLPAVPDSFRIVVESRLQEWDLLPVSQQKEVMKNRVALQYFFRPHHIQQPVLQNTNLITILPPPLRTKLETGLSRWLVLSETERAELTSQFKEFFTLESTDQQKIIQGFPKPRQQELNGPLQMLASMPPQMREECIAGFHKFAQLTPEERHRFLLKLQRWKAMSPEERTVWRRLVTRVIQPPRPPGKQRPPIPNAAQPIPPLPLATNR